MTVPPAPHCAPTAPPRTESDSISAADPGHNRLEQVGALCRTANHARRHLERAVLQNARLTWTSYEVLHLSVTNPRIDTGILAARAGVSKGTVTRAAAALIQRGLLQRATPEQDLRRSQLTPTAKGWALHQQLRHRLITELNRLVNTVASGTGDTALRRHLLHPDDRTPTEPTQDNPPGSRVSVGDTESQQ